MNNIIATLFFIMLVFCGCATKKPAAVIAPVTEQITESSINFSEPATWLLGYFNPGRLAQSPYSTWYIEEYDEYQFNSDVINKLLDINKDNLAIKIVMGTWCPDSRREVPRFMRVLDIWQFPVARVTFIGVDNGKLSTVEEYGKLDIRRVPTFIIYKNNIEAGRIIENPKTSLELDMVNILTTYE